MSCISWDRRVKNQPGPHIGLDPKHLVDEPRARATIGTEMAVVALAGGLEFHNQQLNLQR